MLTALHFQEPFFLFLFIPLALLWLLSKTSTGSKSWSKVIDPKLLPLLLQGEDNQTQRLPRILVAIAWFITVIALADPVWEKVPRPVFQTNAARVLVLDLSNSMLIDDLKPSRLARAKFKIEDILSREEEGQTALVLFAGEAFTASPLTRDTETIRSMLGVLTPQIMPAQGSRADLGLLQAHDLLKQAGSTNGQVLLIADGVSQSSAAITVAQSLRENGHSVSVMGVGTEEGGELNFGNNNNVTVGLDIGSLQAIAENGGGSYRSISTNNSDIENLLTIINDDNLEQNQNDELSDKQEWKSTGPYLVFLLIPFAILAFRKGWLLNIVISCLFITLFSPSQTLIAADAELSNKKPLENKETSGQETSEKNWNQFIDTLTKNKSQRRHDALINQQYEKARDLSSDAFSKGSSEYKLENYEDALENFKKSEGASARYNEGNSLVKLKKYKEAIDAYDQALTLDPTFQDAIDNKKVSEALLKKKEQEAKDKQESENQKEDSEGEEGEEDQKQEGDQDSDSESEQEEKNQSQEQQGKEGDDENNQFSDANEDLDKEEQTEQQDAESKSDDQSEEETEEEAEEKEAQQNQANEDSSEEQEPENIAIEKKEANELSAEEKMAADQWLRRIPDDPGGLLRRKFERQYNRQNRSNNPSEKPW